MNRRGTGQGVHHWYLRALETHFNGNVAALLRALAEEGIDLPYRTAAAWKRPDRAVNIPAWFIVELARVTGLPLDDLLQDVEPAGGGEFSDHERRITSLEGAVLKLIDFAVAQGVDIEPLETSQGD